MLLAAFFREREWCVCNICVFWGCQQLPNELCCPSCPMPQEQRLDQNMHEIEAMAMFFSFNSIHQLCCLWDIAYSIFS